MFVGHRYNSLALVADACHMLSDGLCLLVALVAIKVGKRSDRDLVMKAENTYGWGRAEIIGGLANAIFLLALCVIIILESVEKFIQPDSVEQPLTVCIVGFVGLIMNLFGLVLFQGSGDGHGHSHGGHGHSHGHSHGGHGHSHGESDEDSAEHMNMKGVFLHVLGDAVGSVVVILSSGLMYFYNNCDHSNLENCHVHKAAVECGSFLEESTNITQSDIKNNLLNDFQFPNRTVDLMFPQTMYHWTLYVDPITSLILSVLILMTTLKVLKGKQIFLALKFLSELSYSLYGIE